MEFKNRVAYKSGPSTVLSIPAATVKYLEQKHNTSIHELNFDLVADGDTLIWKINRERIEPKGVAGKFKKGVVNNGRK
ncbi:MAG: hypothetical protein WC554_18800 [Clostridia bacterium]